MTYSDFLAGKQRRHGQHGRACTPADVHPFLHDWQREIVTWAVRKGRAALWEDTGMGKTVQQIEWARLSALFTDDGQGRALIVAPLAVCQQTIREAGKLGIYARYLRADDGQPGLMVTNYEMHDRFDPTTLDAVVLDEASILKQSDGKTRTKLIKHFEPVRARLTCTATPAPNDPEELTSQAEFLGVMPRVEMLAAFFVHDDSGWRLKKHAVQPMYQWMTSWAVALRRPSDIGGSDDGYILPPLRIIPETVAMTERPPDGALLWGNDIGGVGGRAAIRKQTLVDRVQRAVELVNESHLQSTSNGFDVKLTECRGSQSTKPTDEPAWKPTPNIEHGTRSSNGEDSAPPKKTGSTCGSTTNVSPKSSSVPPNSKPFTTPSDAHDTQPTPSIASESRPKVGPFLQNKNAILGCGGNSVSEPPSSTLLLNARGADAPYAGQPSETGPDSASPLTTVMTPVGSEGFSAHLVTSELESSAMTPLSFDAQPIISLEPWIIWCGLNAEQDAIAAALGDRAFSVTGSMSPEEKVRLLYAWIDGERPVMISKTSILGMGVNMQHCANIAFVGLSDSWEQYYQAIRRCWRYGQTREVHAHIVLSEVEAPIAENIARKERQTSRMVDGLVAAMRTQWSVNR